LDELRGESKKAHLCLKLQNRIVGARYREGPEKSGQVPECRQILKRLKLQQSDSKLLALSIRDLVQAAVQRRVILKQFAQRKRSSPSSSL